MPKPLRKIFTPWVGTSAATNPLNELQEGYNDVVDAVQQLQAPGKGDGAGSAVVVFIGGNGTLTTLNVLTSGGV